MKRTIRRANLQLDPGKVRKLRKALRLRSNSEAVRRAMASTEAGLNALRALSKLGGLEDVFGRTSAKSE